jgi:hypothetical protein
VTITQFETPTDSIIGAGTVTLTPPDVLVTLQRIVDERGAEFHTIHPGPDNPAGLAGLVLQQHGADEDLLRFYGPFLDLMDCSIIPDSKFWFIGFTRDMLIEADELDQDGWLYGDILDRLEQGYADRMHETL